MSSMRLFVYTYLVVVVLVESYLESASLVGHLAISFADCCVFLLTTYILPVRGCTRVARVVCTPPQSHNHGGLPLYPLSRRLASGPPRHHVGALRLPWCRDFHPLRCEGLDPHRLPPQPPGLRATQLLLRAPCATGTTRDLYMVAESGMLRDNCASRPKAEPF